MMWKGNIFERLNEQLLTAGFAARELSTRIRHAEPKVIISASCGVEPSRLIRYS